MTPFPHPKEKNKMRESDTLSTSETKIQNSRERRTLVKNARREGTPLGIPSYAIEGPLGNHSKASKMPWDVLPPSALRQQRQTLHQKPKKTIRALLQLRLT